VKQGFAKHFQNLNLKPTRVNNHGYNDPKELYHEKVRIPYRFGEQIWRNNKVEMKAQSITIVVLVYIVLPPSLLHYNNVGVIYLGTSNLRMELIRSIPLYFVAMLQSMVTVTKAPFVTTPAHSVVNMKSRPQTPRET
jgi:hypothetical protein